MTAFHVSGMTCGSCATRIQRAIAAVDDEARVEVSIRDQLVQVSSTATDAELADAIQEAGYVPEKIDTAPSHTSGANPAAPSQCHGSAHSGGSCCR